MAADLRSAVDIPWFGLPDPDDAQAAAAGCDPSAASCPAWSGPAVPADAVLKATKSAATPVPLPPSDCAAMSAWTTGAVATPPAGIVAAAAAVFGKVQNQCNAPLAALET